MYKTFVVGNNITRAVNSYCRVAAALCTLETLFVSRVSRCQLPLACWDCGFETHLGRGGLSCVSVVYCQVEVSATAWSIVERSPNECDVITNNNNSNINNVLKQIDTELTRLVAISLWTQSTMTRIAITYKHCFSARVAQETAIKQKS
jgi:hypothetical protein